MDASPLAAPAALPLSNCYWVLPGLLLAGEHPGGATAAATRVRLRRLLEAGVSCFLDLTQPDELPPYDADLPLGVDYFRKPIPDHGIPLQPGHMAELLDCLREALRSGRVVYLHCRAGIGRTGTVAGCLLVESGLAGEAAVAELNRLWQQSGRAALWPQVPETPEQTKYVRRWERPRAPRADPLFEPATLSAARGLRDRFLGALLGQAVGDAVAAATQFRRPGKFTPVGDMLGGGPFDLPRGGWSDDTAMALCLFAQPAAAPERAAEAARTTCQAPAVLTACRALAQALHAALSGEPRPVILARAQSVLDAALHPMPACGGNTAPAALAAALEAFASTGNFRDAVLSAANLGGNSDVVAAACGALAGAHYTASAIPTLWRNSLIKKQLIESSADRLLA